MDRHILNFFRKENFHEVISLREGAPGWEALSKKCPKLPRGWFELVQLEKRDRIEFTRDYWISKLQFRVGLSDFITKFFNNLDDICIFLTQLNKDDDYHAHMLYSLDKNRGFFRGALPAADEDIMLLQRQFREMTLPKDFISFLTIHNGFWKTTDKTGILGTDTMFQCYENFQEYLQRVGRATTANKKAVNPAGLIPFYESFGMPYFQCFWNEWYPEEEMGNVYFSSDTNSISSVQDGKSSSESLAFPTFSDWLMFYLEQVE